MTFKIDNLLIAGNGFDMDLGLETSYNKFVESDEWNIMRDRRKRDYPGFSLIDYIENEHNQRWFDIEKAMLNYVLSINKGEKANNVEEDKKDYHAICNALVEYLRNLFWKPIPAIVAQKMMNSCAGEILSCFFNPLLSCGHNVMYTFNYTPLEIIYSTVDGCPTTAEYYNIHGGINKDDFLNGIYDGSSIILGIMSKKEIAPDYSFMIKSNHPNYILSNIENDLMSARNVYIFGHSLNPIDFGYFENYFKMLESNTEQERTLTIITKNKNSADNLLKNINIMGISDNKIRAHTKVECVFTDSWNRNSNVQ